MPPDVGPNGADVSYPYASLSPNGRKARFGVAYLRNICAQAGVGLMETSIDEDVLAVDCVVNFPLGMVRVQVKCTSDDQGGAPHLVWKIEQGWKDKWAVSQVPVFFVGIVVDSDNEAWVQHLDDGTRLNAIGVWAPINVADLGSSIKIPRKSRLTAATMQEWHDILRADYTPKDVL